MSNNNTATLPNNNPLSDGALVARATLSMDADDDKYKLIHTQLLDLF